ncbi:hypothetical protein [Oricola indica]|jgi:hypothetical protein|uniref:hypothetical protein n=1 Tax=Oricola indica TaxID=2872591 RepID=UPI001CBE7791|nr:hypothetical protein [Oricola indica]
MADQSTLIVIGKTTVDINDPCAVLTELRKAEILVATGETVSMARFGEDETRFTEANLAGLQKLIARYETLCARKSGNRTRFAATVRFT